MGHFDDFSIDMHAVLHKNDGNMHKNTMAFLESHPKNDISSFSLGFPLRFDTGFGKMRKEKGELPHEKKSQARNTHRAAADSDLVVFPRRMVPAGADISSIYIGSGSTGKSCELSIQNEIAPLLDTLEHTYYIQLFIIPFSTSGYGYELFLRDADGSAVKNYLMGGDWLNLGAPRAILIGAGGGGALDAMLRQYTETGTYTPDAA